jgi:hypothetical protein
MDQGRNSNWGFQASFQGVAPTTGGFRTVDEGYYDGVVEASYVKSDKPNRVIFRIKLTGQTPFQGETIMDGVGAPKSHDDNVRHYWRAILESCGYGAAEIEGAGVLNVVPGLFVGRPCKVYHKPKAGEGEYAETRFLPPAVWAERKVQFEQQQAAAEGAGAMSVGQLNSGLPSMGGGAFPPLGQAPSNPMLGGGQGQGQAQPGGGLGGGQLPSMGGGMQQGAGLGIGQGQTQLGGGGQLPSMGGGQGQAQLGGGGQTVDTNALLARIQGGS